MERSRIPPEALLDPWFHVCMREAIDTPGLIAEFDRLYGQNLSRKGSPVDVEIDMATGRLAEGVGEFAAFVYDCVYTRVPRPEARNA